LIGFKQARKTSAMSELLPGKYRHYKGNDYEVIGTAIHSETRETLVVYKALYVLEDYPKDQLWVRPLEMFTEMVTVNGMTLPRFEHIG
jgi:hypothetical protein